MRQLIFGNRSILNTTMDAKRGDGILVVSEVFLFSFVNVAVVSLLF